MRLDEAERSLGDARRGEQRCEQRAERAERAARDAEARLVDVDRCAGREDLTGSGCVCSACLLVCPDLK